MPTKSIQIHFNAPFNMKRKFDDVLRKAGVSSNDAYRIFMQQTINHRGLPFPVTAEPKEYKTVVNHPHFSKETLKALKDDDTNQLTNFNLKKLLEEVLSDEQ